MQRRAFLATLGSPFVRSYPLLAETLTTFSFRRLDGVAFTLPTGPYSSLSRSRDGDLFWLAFRRKEVVRINGKTGAVEAYSLTQIPEIASGACDIIDDVQTGRSGAIYVPGVLRLPGVQRSFVLFMVDSTGRYERMVNLHPPAEVRHVAFDDSGAVYVLGVDAAYLRRTTDQCLVVHKYDRSGNKTHSFSPAPDVEYLRLKDEVDRGHLWLTPDGLAHVLPCSRILRVLNPSDGNPISEIRFTLPDGGRPAQIRSIVPIAGGRYLISWVLSQGSAGFRQNRQLLSMHDGAGMLIGRPNDLRREEGAPLFSDGAGNVYLLRSPAANVYELARVAVEPHSGDTSVKRRAHTAQAGASEPRVAEPHGAANRALGAVRVRAERDRPLRRG